MSVMGKAMAQTVPSTAATMAIMRPLSFGNTVSPDTPAE